MPTARRPAARSAATTAGACLVALAAVAAACTGAPGRGAPPPAAASSAEFLVVAGDSTYWVTSGPAGVRVRASPLFLARWGGRLAEVFVADEERAFDDGAWFATQRIYRRDLLTGDSALVFADPAVPRMAARHAAVHPDARLLDPDERPDDTEDPDDAGAHAPLAAPAAAATVALAASHGPYLSLEQHTETSAALLSDGASDGALGGIGDTATGADAAPFDEVRRRVVDLRTGREAALADLFGPAAARAVEVAGQQAFRTSVDALRPAAARAVRQASGEGADAPRRALAALGTLHFDARNFALTARAGRPAVTFVALGRDGDGGAVTLPLPSVAVPGPAPAWWRTDVEPTLFVGAGADAPGDTGAPAGAARWHVAGGAYEVRARVAAGAAALELVPALGAATPRAARVPPGTLPNTAHRAPAAPAASLGARRALPLARVPAPLLQLIPLDAGTTDPAMRRALRRAFDESAFYDDVTTSVAWAPDRPAPALPPARRLGARLGARLSVRHAPRS